MSVTATPWQPIGPEGPAAVSLGNDHRRFLSVGMEVSTLEEGGKLFNMAIMP